MKELVAVEREHILNSFLFSQSGNLSKAKDEASKFVTTRYSRYEALGKVQINDPALSPMSCMDIESKASVVEGIPEFIGIGTLLRLNLLVPEQVKDYFSAVDNAFYYRFPLFQALIIYSTSPEDILKTLEEPGAGIDRIFKQWISESIVHKSLVK